MGKHFDKRLCLWVSIGRPIGVMWLGTTNADKDLTDRTGCIKVEVVLPGKGRIQANLRHYVSNSTLSSQEISDWIYRKGLARTKGSPNPSLPFGFKKKNGEHLFEYIGVQLPDVNV